jgi:aspartyl-tRNA synthetase
MKTGLRTHTCNDLSSKDEGKKVVLCGFVHRKRNLGHFIFIDLRDQYGIVQLVLEKAEHVEKLSHESVIQVEGTVQLRQSENKGLKTGQIEVLVQKLNILSHAKTPPFEITQFSEEANEELRLKYRYLDLRKGPLLHHLQLRHRVQLECRRLLDQAGFLEVQTPILCKSTPEGARDYLVPSRLYPGHFFALAQSPQQFKQLLMIGGVDRYFQIAPCFRDEDSRPDRQPEFYQIDIEMSMASPKDLFVLIERWMQTLFKQILNVEVKTPFRRLNFAQCMEMYGSDKPDLRYGMELKRFDTFAKQSSFSIFLEALKKKETIKGLCAPGCGHYSRKQIDDLVEKMKLLGLKGLAFFKVEHNTLSSPIAKFFEDHQTIITHFGAKEGDLILILADEEKLVNLGLDQLRRYFAKELHLESNTFEFLWVDAFPLFEWDAQLGRYFSVHHPFTAPHPDDVDHLKQARSLGYDLVLNGCELAGGSQRIHSYEMQCKVFEILGMTHEAMQAQFSHFLEALSYGCPPHLGIAMGLDRLLMLMSKTHSIRDMIAFPKTTHAQDLMLKAPARVDEERLKELHLYLK